MKKTIKNLLGSRNSTEIGILIKALGIKRKRFLRALGGRFDNNLLSPVKVFGLPNAHVFFGYYEVPQFSRDEKRLLAISAPLINKAPPLGSIVRLGFYDLNDEFPELREFGSSSVWCWQQGCRLQWYPSESAPTVLYNDLIGDQYGSVVQDVNSGKVVKTIPRPIYALSPDGKLGLSLNFSRLQRLRPGYGYNNLPDDESMRESAPSRDGIWCINMVTGTEKMLFSIHDISEINKEYSETGVHHYFNHILFNKSGDRFMFFHVLQLTDGVRKIRLLTSRIDGNDIRVINNSGHASHYCWMDDNHLLCYSTVKGKGEGYFLFDTRSGESRFIGAGTLNRDGHPSYLPGGKQMITDTYPDQYGELSLLLYDIVYDRVKVIHKQYMPSKFNAETRCDFHPRISPSGNYVCIDCIDAGKRTMKLFDISVIKTNVYCY